MSKIFFFTYEWYYKIKGLLLKASTITNHKLLREVYAM